VTEHLQVSIPSLNRNIIWSSRYQHRPSSANVNVNVKYFSPIDHWRRVRLRRSRLAVMSSSGVATSPAGRETSVNLGSSNDAENADEKPRLSEHEKKANHIASGEPTCRLYHLSPGILCPPPPNHPHNFNPLGFKERLTSTRRTKAPPGNPRGL
jgi:hypothetical protein